MVGINWAATIGVFKILGTNGFRIAFIGGESSSRHRTILFPSTKSARALPSSSTQCCSTNGDLSAKAGTRSKKSCSSSAKTLSVEEALAKDGDGLKDSRSWGWTGGVVARVLPKKYFDYETRKPSANAIDPSSLQHDIIEASAPEQETSNETDPSSLGRNSSEGIFDYISDFDPSGCHCDGSGTGDGDLFVSLDVSIENRIDSVSGEFLSRGGTMGGSAAPAAGDIKSNEKHVVFFHMRRDANEPVSKTLRRLEISTKKKLRSKCLELQGSRPTETYATNIASKVAECTSKLIVKKNVTIGWDDVDEMEVSHLTSFEVWRKLLVKDGTYPRQRGSVGIALLNPDSDCLSQAPIFLDVVSCPPTILKVNTFENFEASVFVGVPLVIETEVAFSSRAIITWYVDGIIVLYDKKCYTPAPEDIGKSLSVLIIPTRNGHDGAGCEEAYRYKNLIEPLPFMPIMSPIRDQWMARSLEEKNDLRVVTYNVLADLYTSRDIDEQIVYSHCDSRHLLRQRRMPMLVAEILAYQADLVCLQEVDASIYENLLRPVFFEEGFEGFYSNKASIQQEGCAMFWSKDCFEPAQNKDMHTQSIRELFTRDESNHACQNGSKDTITWDSMDAILCLLDEHAELRRVTRENTGQIIQIATLALKKPRGNVAEANKPNKICVANTHLFYHPMADHVRALQSYVLCKRVDDLRRKEAPAPIPFILCGDLNSDPMSGAVELLLKRELLPENNETWKNLNEYRWEMGEDEHALPDDGWSRKGTVQPPSIVLPRSFPNITSGCPEMPRFTNYAVDFAETLDYIFVSECSDQEPFGFKPSKAAPMPKAEEISPMPNEFMPSDHISLVCDLEYMTMEGKADDRGRSCERAD